MTRRSPPASVWRRTNACWVFSIWARRKGGVRAAPLLDPADFVSAWPSR